MKRTYISDKYKAHMYAMFGRAIIVCSVCIAFVILAMLKINNRNISGHVDNILLNSNNFVINAGIANESDINKLQIKIYNKIYNEQKNKFYHFVDRIL